MATAPAKPALTVLAADIVAEAATAAFAPSLKRQTP